MRNKLLVLVLIIGLVWGISSGALGFNWNDVRDKMRLPGLPQLQVPGPLSQEGVKILKEESLVIDVVDRVSPSVVTIGIEATVRRRGAFQIDPFDPFSIFRETPGAEEEVKQDIGSGFIVTADGLIVTNK